MAEITDLIPLKDDDSTMDGYLTNVCLMRTMGQVVHNREFATDVKAYTVNSMIFNAVFEADVDLLKTIIKRVDGLVPDEDKCGAYSNILGDALDDVLSYDRRDALRITPDDPVIIAIAKVLVFKATNMAGSNQMLRKERNAAAQVILERTGGRKVGPTRMLVETRYVEPDWMALDDGSGDSEMGGHVPDVQAAEAEHEEGPVRAVVRGVRGEDQDRAR